MKKIGFIGLGIMGRPMAKNLLKAGFSLVVYDINSSAVDDLVKAGAQAAEIIKGSGREDGDHYHDASGLARSEGGHSWGKGA